MRKPKVECFHYKKYNDIYVSGVAFSSKAWLSLLNIFFKQEIIVLTETDESNIKVLSSIGDSMGISAAAVYFPTPRFSAVCSTMRLQCLFNYISMNDVDGAFIADIKAGITPTEFIGSIDRLANSMVKREMSDASVYINFPENEITISFANDKYEVKAVEKRIYSIFGE